MHTRNLCIAAGLLTAAQTASAFTFSKLNTDAEFSALLGSGDITELWVAQGRIGNAASNGDQEFDLGFDSGSPADQRQYAWGNNQPVSVNVSYDAGTDVLTFTAAGLSTMTLANAGAATDIYIRVRATNQRPDLSVDLSNVFIDAVAVGSIGTNNTTLDGVEYLVISGIGGNSFSLEARATLDFNPSNPPGGSNLAFQIKGVVPTPASAALLTLAGAATLARRRK